MLPITYKKPFSQLVGGTVVNVTTGQNISILTFIAASPASAGYVQLFYKVAADVTLGTTVADTVIPFPAGGVILDVGWHINSGHAGLSIAVTTDRTGLTGVDTDIFILHT